MTGPGSKTGLALLVFLVSGAVPAWGQAEQKKDFPRVGIRGTELRHLDSEILGERLEIDVSLPRGDAGESERYPVVYVLDAETNFGATSSIAHRLMKNKDIPKVLVVGIAYDTSYQDFYRKRTRDLTPVAMKRFPRGGGAGRFASFLRDELFPFIDGAYRTEAGDRALYGHSFGGLFAFYVLFEHPGLFQRILAVSPSIWYGERYLMRKERELAKEGSPPVAILYTAVGADESGYFVKDWEELTKSLRSRNYPGLAMRSEILKENHRSIFGVAFTNGLRSVFREP